MLGQLDCTGFAVWAEDADSQSGLHQTRHVVGVEAVAAVIGLANLIGTVDLVTARSRNCSQDFAGFDEGTSEVGDDRLGSVGVVFLVAGSGHADNIASEFQHGMLAPATGAEERPLVLACVSNDAERAFYRAIRACRHTPESGVVVQRSGLGRFGGQP